MSRRDDVLRILAGRPDGLTDAAIARELKRQHSKATHQIANTICRALAADGLIVRDSANSPITNRLSTRGVGSTDTSRPATDPTQPWPWEGAVQAAVVSWLTNQGGRVISQADTASRQRGTDIVAEVASGRVYIEVKGWPSSSYADPRRAGEIKPTAPTVQAAHWFAGAISTALKLRQSYPLDRVAVALPDMPRYRTLQDERAEPLGRIGVEVWLVAETGAVTSPELRAG